MKPNLRQLFFEHVGQTSDFPMGLEVERAEGVWLLGPNGKKWIDLISGVSVSNVGHNNPAVVEAVCSQARDYLHLMVYGEVIQSPQVRYAARIAELLPPRLQSVYFVNSGSEAVEGALKLAKRYTGRTELVSFKNAYHGSTHGSLSVMGGEEYRNSYRPLLPDVRQLRFNRPEDLEQITARTACVIVEPVQGEGGIQLPAPGFLEALRRRCDETGALLIFDEIQTGTGRTGTLYYFQQAGVTPDILCTAKSFGGGMPLGAFISSDGIMSTLKTNPVLGHITTFGGHPVCCAAGRTARRGDGPAHRMVPLLAHGAAHRTAADDHRRRDRRLVPHPARCDRPCRSTGRWQVKHIPFSPTPERGFFRHPAPGTRQYRPLSLLGPPQAALSPRPHSSYPSGPKTGETPRTTRKADPRWPENRPSGPHRRKRHTAPSDRTGQHCVSLFFDYL